MISDIERAWAAGFFEGEGHVQIVTPPSNRTLGTLSVEIQQVDPAPLEWLHSRWGGQPHYVCLRNHKGRPYYRWVRIAANAAAFLRGIEPFVVRPHVKARVRLAIEFQAQKSRGHDNRLPGYRERQLAYAATMKGLNGRGINGANFAIPPSIDLAMRNQLNLFSAAEKAALATRVRA